MSRRIRWARHVALIEKRMNACSFWWKLQKERDQHEVLHVGGKIILKWILEK
jgi:hypothetical protein